VLRSDPSKKEAEQNNAVGILCVEIRSDLYFYYYSELFFFFFFFKKTIVNGTNAKKILLDKN